MTDKSIYLSLLGILLPLFALAHSGEVLKAYDTPGDYPTGLTWDGKYLWQTDRKTDKIYAIDPANGKIQKELEAPAYWPTGLAWDGQFIWCMDTKGGIPKAENYQGIAYQIDPSDNSILRQFVSPAKQARGLTFDGVFLWCADNASDQLIQFDPKDGTTIRSIPAPSGHPQGLAWDGKYLWVSDRISDEIYMVNPENGSVIITTDAPGKYSRGLTYDGDFLWNIDYQDRKLYKLVHKDNEKITKWGERHSKVNYLFEATNYGPGAVKDMEVHFALGTNRDNQEITRDFEFTPQYTGKKTDHWGQKTAYFTKINMKAGETAEFHMSCDVKTWNIRYFIFPEETGELKDIPDEIKGKYLADNQKYSLQHPVIQEGVKDAVGDDRRPYWIARKIFDYLIDNMYYEMSGGWNTAPTVLERGNGSCSEYSFVYIAMCRAAGLPARYVGSVVVRGDAASHDDVFHRWVEVYFPNYGWIPVDPSGGDQDSPRAQARYFGALSNRFFITTQSGGGSESMEWTYNSNHFEVSEPKTHLVVEYFADWEPLD